VAAKSEKISIDYKALAELLNGSMRMHRDATTLEHWLELFSVLTDSDGTASLRWTHGNPGRCIESYQGAVPAIPPALREQIDTIVAQSGRRAPGFLDDFLELGSATDIRDSIAAVDPRYLLAIVDWNPACIVVVMARAPNRPLWNDADRQRIREILPYVRESVLVHKQMDRNRYISGLARDVLDKSPRGVLILSEDGKIQMANARAAAILAVHDGLSDRDGKLVINNKDVAARLSDYLGKLDTMGDAGLPEMDWNMVVEKPSGAAPYQLILGHLTLSDWNLESRRSDKVAVIHVHDPDKTVGVQPEQLSDFYGFTKAQARLAAKLFQGHTINEAAEALHISVNTARTHMRGIYAKTGVRTQAELLGMLSTGLTSYGESVNNL